MGLLFLLSVSSSLPHSSQAFYFSCFVLFIFPISLFLRLPSFPWSCSSFIWVLLWFYSLIFGCSLPHLLSLLSLSIFLITPSLLVPSSVSSFLLGSSLLTFLGLILFLAMVVVVSILDLSLGGFTS